MKWPGLHKNFWYTLLRVSLPVYLLGLSVFFYVGYIDLNGIKSRHKIIRENLIRENSNIIGNTLTSLVSDLNYLSEILKPESVTQSPNLSPSTLESNLLSFARNRHIYHQLRIIDSQGFEQVRINYKDGVSSVVQPNDLQHKGDRYYMQEIQELTANEIYISPFDLNKENNEIEIPYNPVLRIGKRLMDSINNNEYFLILNYSGTDLLEKIADSSTAEYSHLALLNQNGYFLQGIHPDQSWKFMFSDSLEGHFKTYYPSEWNVISGQRKSGHITTSNGYFTFYKFNFCNYFLSESAYDHYARFSRCPEWILISFTDKRQVFASLLYPAIRKYIFFALILGLAIVIVTFVYTRIRNAQMYEKERRKTQYRFMQRMVEAIPNPIFYLDYINNEFGCNDAFTELTGKQKSELKNMRIEKLFADSKKKAIPKKNQPENVKVSEMKLNYPDGSLRHLLYYKAAIVLNKEQGGLVGVFNDITEIKKAEVALRDSESKLKAANRTKNRFFSIIAHDLKNPFHAILGLSHLLKTNFQDMSDEDKIYISENIYHATENTYQLLLNLLDWARLQEGKIKAKPVLIDLRLLADESISLHQAKLTEKNINTTVTIEPDQRAFADDNMVRTIFRNLLSNAIKFTEEGGSIEIGSHSKNKFHEIYVQDSGVGIKTDVQKNLFRADKRGRANGSGEEQGTGLGLLLCKDFVHLNQGRIWVESAAGEGSTFFFTLPLSNGQV